MVVESMRVAARAFGAALAKAHTEYPACLENVIWAIADAYADTHGNTTHQIGELRSLVWNAFKDHEFGR